MSRDRGFIIVAMTVIFCALFCGASVAYETEMTDLDRLLPKYVGPGTNLMFTGSLPAIFKKDLQGGTQHQRGELLSSVGDPVYTLDKEGNLTGAFIAELVSNPANNLWEGNVRFYEYANGSLVEGLPTGESGVTETWNLKNDFAKMANSSLNDRRLFFWFGNGTNLHSLNNSVGSGIFQASPHQFPTDSDPYFSNYLGLGNGEQISSFNGEPKDLISPLTSYNFHPSRMILAWLMGADYRVDSSGNVTRSSTGRTVLPDLGQGGMALIDKKIGNSGNTARVLFMQTNDGLLHAINVDGNKSLPGWGGDGGREIMAYAPPNVLNNKKIISQKFKMKKEKWNPSGSSDSWQTFEKTFASSWINAGAANPSFMTDGGVVAKDLMKPNDEKTGIYNIGSDEKETYIFGMMGRGGAGLHSLRMDSEGNFRFNWAVENILYPYAHKDGGVDNTGSGISESKYFFAAPSYRLWAPVDGYTGNGTQVRFDRGAGTGYQRLGWNAPPPVLGAVRLTGNKAQNVMFLSAGQQYTTDLQYNGTFGAALYVINPHTGGILYDKTAADSPAYGLHMESGPQKFGDRGRSMPYVATLMAPPTPVYQDDDEEFLRSVFFADNRGHIMEMSFTAENYDGREKPFDSVGQLSDLFKNDSSSTFRKDVNPRLVASLIKNIGSGGGGGDQCNLIPYKFAVMSDKDAQKRKEGRDIWVCGGTSNMPTLKIANSKTISNSNQYIFGFNRLQHDVNPTSLGNGNEIRVSITKYGRSLSAEDKPVKLDVDYYSKASLAIPKDTWGDAKESINAWHIPLKTSTGEYVSCSPLMYYNEKKQRHQLYVATYLPDEQWKYNDDGKSGKGVSRLYLLDPMSGEGWWPDPVAAKYYELENIYITNLSLVNIDGNPEVVFSHHGNVGNAKKFNEELGGGKLTADNSQSVNVTRIDADGEFVKNNKPATIDAYIQYWRRYTIKD